jgi:L-fuculose-phosphate aldolase
MNQDQARADVAYFMCRLYRQKLTTTSGGNISVRVGDDMIAITPSALDKARTRPDQVSLMRTNGENLTPALKPSIETQMHLLIFERCPRAKAIVHAHPVTASAFTASRTPINCHILAESYAVLGDPITADYAMMSTDRLAELVADAATKADCVLMQNHGVVTLGTTLLQAFDRLELIEAAAQMTLIARQLGDVETLDSDQRQDLDKLMGREPQA